MNLTWPLWAVTLRFRIWTIVPEKNKACILHTHTKEEEDLGQLSCHQRVLTPDHLMKTTMWEEKEDLKFRESVRITYRRLVDGIQQKAKTARIFAAWLYRLDLSTNALTSQQTTPELLVPTFPILETPFLYSLFSNAAGKINPTLGLWVLILNSGTLRQKGPQFSPVICVIDRKVKSFQQKTHTQSL